MPITTNGNTLIKDGLVLYLDAANKRSYPGSGTTWYDLSGNRNNGTLTNTPTFSSANKGCFEFNGSSNFITLGNILNLTSQTQLTLSAWQYKKNNSDGISNAIFTSENNNTSGGILFYNHATGPNKLMFAVDNNTPSGYYNEEIVYSNDSLSLDSWQQVCSVFNSGNVYNYINGVLNGVGTGLASSITMNKPCYIGKRPYAGFEAFFDGFISTFQIYNTSLNATQVLQNYNATKGRYLTNKTSLPNNSASEVFEDASNIIWNETRGYYRSLNVWNSPPVLMNIKNPHLIKSINATFYGYYNTPTSCLGYNILRIVYDDGTTDNLGTGDAWANSGDGQDIYKGDGGFERKVQRNVINETYTLTIPSGKKVRNVLFNSYYYPGYNESDRGVRDIQITY